MLVQRALHLEAISVEVQAPKPAASRTSSTVLRRSRYRSRLEIAQEVGECLLLGVVVFPVAEIRDEVLADLARGIFACVRVKTLPFSDLCKWHQAHGEKHLALFVQLLLSGMCDLGL